MNLILNLLKYAEPEKEFIVSVITLLILTSILYVLTKSYISFREKQKECDGKFNLHAEKIINIGRVAEKADSKATEAIESVREIKPKVDELHKHFIDDKFKQKVVNG